VSWTHCHLLQTHRHAARWRHFVGESDGTCGIARNWQNPIGHATLCQCSTPHATRWGPAKANIINGRSKSLKNGTPFSVIWVPKQVSSSVQEGYSSDTTSSDTSWVPTVIIFAHPFGNCWRPLCFWDLFFHQLSFFVLPLYVLFHPIFMARLPVPPLLIAGLHSALSNVRHCFSQRWRKRCSLPLETVWKGQPSTGSHQYFLCFGWQLCQSHD
jgi:hypothetical protein